MSMFLGVIAFCMQGQCAFWKSELYQAKEQCEAATVQMIDEIMKQDVQLVQGVCLPIELGKSA